MNANASHLSIFRATFLIMLVALPLAGCESPGSVLTLVEREVEIGPGISLLALEISQGKGEPVVFVPGMPDDERCWGLHLGGFIGDEYRAIEYGRRYDSSHDPILQPCNPKVRADDLLRLLDGLGLEKVHVVGHAHGAYAALLFALDHPDRVRTLTLTEPPIVPWLDEVGGDQVLEAQWLKHQFYGEMIGPVRDAFESGEDQRALETYLDFFFVGGRAFDKLRADVLQACRYNTSELKALMLSDDPYPPVDRSRVRELRIPTLILSGAMTTEFGAFIDQQLDTLLPADTHDRVVIEYAGHWLWHDNSEACQSAVLEFIRSR